MKESYDFSKARRGVHAQRLRDGHRIRVVNGDRTETLTLEAPPQSVSARSSVRRNGMDHLLHKLEMFDVGIAKPVSTSPVHLIAYRPFPENSDRFEACPVVLTVSSRNRIHLKKDDAAIPNLLLTFVWFATEKTDPEIYALPFVELKQVFDDRGYTRNPAWHDNGFWTIPHPDTGLKDFMQLHRITSGAEWEREVQAALRKV